MGLNLQAALGIYGKNSAISQAITAYYNKTHEGSHLKFKTFLAINHPEALDDEPKIKHNKNRRYNSPFHGSKF